MFKDLDEMLNVTCAMAIGMIIPFIMFFDKIVK